MNEETLHIIQALGIPTICASFGGVMITYIVTKFKKEKSDMQAIKTGVQAVLRSQLLQMYEACCEKGYANVDTKATFENCYKQYHNLGSNGVMDSIHAKFLKLPDRPKNKTKSHY